MLDKIHSSHSFARSDTSPCRAVKLTGQPESKLSVSGGAGSISGIKSPSEDAITRVEFEHRSVYKWRVLSWMNPACSFLVWLYRSPSQPPWSPADGTHTHGECNYNTPRLPLYESHSPVIYIISACPQAYAARLLCTSEIDFFQRFSCLV